MPRSKKRILLGILGIVGIAGLSYALLLGVPPTFDAPVLEIPIKETQYACNIDVYGIPDWSGPGTHHNGIDIVINHSVTVLSPVKGTIVSLSENKNEFNPRQIIMWQINIQVNWGWQVSLVLEPKFDGSDDANNTLQRNAIKASLFQRVNVGDDLGTLYYGYDHASIHYMVTGSNGNVCPYTYSTPTAQAFLDSLLPYQSNPTVCLPVT